MVSGQEEGHRHNLNLGLNVTTFLANSVTGIGSHAEYGHRVSPGAFIVGRVMGASGLARFGNGFDHSRAIGGSISSRFIPFHRTFPELKVDIGVIYNRITDRMQPASDRSNTDPNIRTTTRHRLGPAASLALGLIQSDRMDTGIRADILTSIVPEGLDTDMVQAGIYMGIRF